tara:strand:- start:123 stop:1121 length:999 start_codon:yes stop_codon:yes gene_type:complete
MPNKYIFFRTDRIGDFLLSAILIKSIKRSDKNSFITIVASKKNYSYIKNFSFVDEVILFPDSYLLKIFFYLKFIYKKFYLIGILDGKKRSIYFSFLTRSKYKILFTYKKFYKNCFNFFFYRIFYDDDCINKISEIKEFLNLLNFNLETDDLNTINKNSVLIKDLGIPLYNKYSLLHFDEKWIFKDYIKDYISIEPNSENILITFLEQLIVKTNNDLYVSAGNLSNKFIIFIKKNFIKIEQNVYELKFKDNKIIFFDNINFLQLEKLILNSALLITCHGAASHVAASFNLRIVDIIDDSEEVFFDKWTNHFTNYQKLSRVEFIKLSKNIINLI